MRQHAAPMLAAAATVLAAAQAQNVCPEWTEEGLDGLDISPECFIACAPGTIAGPIPLTLSTVQFGAECLVTAVSMNNQSITGSIPDNLGSFPVNFIDFSFNSGIVGEIPASLRANSNLQSLSLSNTGISGSTENLGTGWANNIASIRLENTQIGGSVVSQELETFLTTHPSLAQFSFSGVDDDSDECINGNAINEKRIGAGLESIAFSGAAFCLDSPTPPPSVFAPVTPAPTEPTTSPSGAPSISPTPRPSSGPTRNPTKEPTEAPPTARPTAPTPRTLPPSDAGRLSLSAVCIAVATAGLALALQN